MSAAVLDWLLDSDPAIRWQVMRDLLDAPEAEWTAERAKLETEGWGARLLAARDPDGQWAGAAFWPPDVDWHRREQDGQPWTATCWALTDLREFGLDPASESARRTVELVGENSPWEEGNQPFWDGEVEECINGRTAAVGAYFGVDVGEIVTRLVGERQSDGGWNCERANGSVRASFHSTINVLEGLLEHEKATGGTAATREARRAGETYLLERRLFRRLSTGAPADPDFLRFVHPNRYRYDILRALDYFRATAALDGVPPDPRLGEAVAELRRRRFADGRWPLDWTPRGRVWFAVDDGPGQPSRWVTLRALRVLRWWEGADIGSTGDEEPGNGKAPRPSGRGAV